MGIVIFFVLAAIAAGIIAYPLLPGRRTPVQPAPVVTEAEIERSVRNLRRTRSRGGLSCPSCGKAYQEGDRFCVRCGGSLPEAEAQSEPDELVCSSCGASLHAGDQFCAKCGHLVAKGEVV